jgi:hypothetical protein
VDRITDKGSFLLMVKQGQVPRRVAGNMKHVEIPIGGDNNCLSSAKSEVDPAPASGIGYWLILKSKTVIIPQVVVSFRVEARRIPNQMPVWLPTSQQRDRCHISNRRVAALMIEIGMGRDKQCQSRRISAQLVHVGKDCGFQRTGYATVDQHHAFPSEEILEEVTASI